MKIKFSRNALRFLDKIIEKDKERIRQKTKNLVLSIEKQKIIPKQVEKSRLYGSTILFLIVYDGCPIMRR